METSALAGLGEQWLSFLSQLGTIAQSRGMRAYVVGGPVRDLLLGLRPTDVDVMLEGDALAFTTYLAQQWSKLFPELPLPKKPVHFAKFGTAKLLFPEKLFEDTAGRPPAGQPSASIDFSTARKESYPASGAQPIVSPGDLQSDLARRDFSVNAMAFAVSPVELGKLYDMFHGAEHLVQKVLAVLHARSFEDDPARLIRAVRFSERLGFSLEQRTAALFADAAAGGYLLRLPTFRLFDEFRKALSEVHVLPVLLRLERDGLLRQVHERAVIDRRLLTELEGRAGGEKNDGESTLVWERRLRLLFAALDANAFGRELRRFELQDKVIARLSAVGTAAIQ